MSYNKYIQIKKFKKINLISLMKGLRDMEYTVEDVRRIIGAKTTGTVRVLLCLPEFEKKRTFGIHSGKGFKYILNAQELKKLRELFEKRRNRRYGRT